MNSVRDLIALSIGTNTGWWGSKELGNRLAEIRKGKLGDAEANEYKREIEKALRWLIEDGLVLSVSVRVQREAKGRLNYWISAKLPSGEIVEDSYAD